MYSIEEQNQKILVQDLDLLFWQLFNVFDP